MSKKKNSTVSNKAFSVENLAQQIFQDIYTIAHESTQCVLCQSKNIKLTDESLSIYKCSDCNGSFSPRTNSLFHRVKYPNDKWIKILTCMINDESLEITVKSIQSSAESIKRRWTMIYENVNWEHYNILVRDKPTKNIYADFEVVIG